MCGDGPKPGAEPARSLSGATSLPRRFQISRAVRRFMPKIALPATARRAKGRAPDFANLDPPPIAFADRERAHERSVFSLYQVVSQGLEGTAMQSFASLPEEDRWALAFRRVMAYRATSRGEQIWREDPRFAPDPDMAALVGPHPGRASAQDRCRQGGRGDRLLRVNPAAVVAVGTARSSWRAPSCGESLEAMVAATGPATELALSAYLDGFEPVEAVLRRAMAR